MPKSMMLLCMCLIAMFFFITNGDETPKKMCGDKTDYNTNDWYKGARKMQALLLHDRYIDYDMSLNFLDKLSDKMYAKHAVKLPFKSRLTEILFQFTALNDRSIDARIYLGDATQWTLAPMVTSGKVEYTNITNLKDARDVFIKMTFLPKEKICYMEVVAIYRNGQLFNSDCGKLYTSVENVTHLYVRANPATTVLKRISLVGWSKD